MSGWADKMPWDPPEGMVEWAVRRKLNGVYFPYRMAYITDPLTEMKKKMVKASCTACGDVWHENYVEGPACARYAPAPFGFTTEQGPTISGETMKCPRCGAVGKVIHIGKIATGGTFADECWVTTFHRVEGHLVVIGWHVMRQLVKDEKKVAVLRTSWHPFEGYLFHGKKAVRLTAYRRCMTSVALFDRWEERARYSDEWGLSDLIYGGTEAMWGTDAENSRLDLYLKTDGEHWPVSYLRLWQKHPQVENLLVQGAGNLLNDLMLSSRYAAGYYGKERLQLSAIPGIDWHEKRPSRMLYMNADEFRAASRGGWRLEDLRMFWGSREAGQPLTAAEIDFIRTIPGYLSYHMQYKFALDKGIPLMKGYRYMKKQMEKYPAEADRIDFAALADYYEMVRARGGEIYEGNRWPQHLMAAHDAELQLKKNKETAALQEGFRRRYAELSELAWEKDGILIRPAENEGELIREGESLHHCVATYARQHAKGTGGAIFFIRRATAPDVSWYTLQLDDKRLKVLQNRGIRNCERTEEIRQFELEWLEHIRLLRKKKNRRKTA